MALERCVLVLPVEDLGRKLLGCAITHGILEHIMIANGRFLFVTLTNVKKLLYDARCKASHLERMLQLAHA